MTTQPNPQTVEQLELRGLAEENNPDFATQVGRSMADVQETFSYMAANKRPLTVMGVFISPGPYALGSTLLGGGAMTTAHIGSRLSRSSVELDENGDTYVDVLKGLVQLGFVEEIAENEDRPTYRLPIDSLPDSVASWVKGTNSAREALRREEAERSQKREERNNRQKRFSWRSRDKTGV